MQLMLILHLELLIISQVAHSILKSTLLPPPSPPPPLLVGQLFIVVKICMESLGAVNQTTNTKCITTASGY